VERALRGTKKGEKKPFRKKGALGIKRFILCGRLEEGEARGRKTLNGNTGTKYSVKESKEDSCAGTVHFSNLRHSYELHSWKGA